MLLQPRTFKTRQHDIIIYPRGNPTEPVIELVRWYDHRIIIVVAKARKCVYIVFLIIFIYFSHRTDTLHFIV